MDDETYNRLQLKHRFERAERNMNERLADVRTRFPVKLSGGNVKMLLREGGNCLDEFLDGPWQEIASVGHEAAEGLRQFAKAIEKNVLAYAAALSRNNPNSGPWKWSLEAASIFGERAEVAIATFARQSQPAHTPEPPLAHTTQKPRKVLSRTPGPKLSFEKTLYTIFKRNPSLAANMSEKELLAHVHQQWPEGQKKPRSARTVSAYYKRWFEEQQAAVQRSRATLG